MTIEAHDGGMNVSNAPRLLWMLGAALLICGASWIAWRAADRTIEDSLRSRGAAALDLQAEALSGWLSRYRALPSLYAQDKEARDFLTGPKGPAEIAHMNRKLENWNALSGASDTYLMDADGVALAASNWAEPYSFVGKSYAFRPYYIEAMKRDSGRYFALGTQSKKRGYYFSHVIRDGGRKDGAILGVMVVKAPIARIESDLKMSEGEAFVSDGYGVIILSPRAEWRLKSLSPLSEGAQTEIRSNRQFGDGPVKTVRLDLSGDFQGGSGSSAVTPGAKGGPAQEVAHLSRRLEGEEWRLHLFMPLASAHEQAYVVAALAGALSLAATLLIALLRQRRRRMLMTLKLRQDAERRLESAVISRTMELQQSNERLEEEVEERRATEERLRTTQQELVQAAKLAALGQMATSLSHEYNQPLAAIRAYAENALSFLKLDRRGEAEENLSRIAAMTKRMADLSKNLTSFARKPNDTVEPIALTPVCRRSIELLQGTLERKGVTVSMDCPDHLAVMGDETRLQQVLVNLIGNAAAACAGAADPRVTISATARGGLIDLRVSDNGPGVPTALREKIFDPFFTTKDPGEGLGLGLSITFNIVKDFGGSIRVEDASEGGARFVLQLCAATATAEALV